MASPPKALVWQQERDTEGSPYYLRDRIETIVTKEWDKASMDRIKSKAQLLTLIDRLLSDEGRCAAYCAALDEVMDAGVSRVVVLGLGSLIPALHAAANGAQVCIVESSLPLAAIARAAAEDNKVSPAPAETQV